MRLRDLTFALSPKQLTPPVTRVYGVVAAVRTAPTAQVDVYLNGSTVLTTGLRHQSSYTPTVGDHVAVDVRGPADILVASAVA